MRANNIKIEHLNNPIGIDITTPYISWTCLEGIIQTAYEITGKKGNETVFETGKVKSSDMYAYYTAPLSSGDRVDISIRLYDENDKPGEVENAFFEMGLLAESDWKAKWINAEVENLTEVNRRPASYLKKNFTINRLGSGRLYITAHGLYVANINGKRVGDQVLTPGPSEYEKRLEYQTYDVSELLVEGENIITVILGDGWYRGKSGMNNVGGNLFGSDLSLLAMLTVDGKAVCVTDETWQASGEGPIRANGLDFGEIVDARLDDIPETAYHFVRLEDCSLSKLVCSNSLPVKEKEEFEPILIRTPKGENVLDFGQNMAGYISFSVNAQAGQIIKLVHGETLDKDGNFTIDNFQHASMAPEKMIYQKIEYTCKEGHNEYRPHFAIFGFQYALVEGDIDPESISFKAHAVYSDMKETGFFSCGNDDVNKLFANSMWSMKGNFAHIPTDCPTRERQGWTGDAGAFVGTGAYLMDCYPVFRKWLNEVRLEQLPNGKVPGVAPKNEVPGRFKLMSDGSAGWADAIGIVPDTLARLYNCKDIISENYDAFKNWVDFSEKRAKKSRLKARFKFDKTKKYIVDTGFHWGEWLEPGVDTRKVLTTTIMKGAPEVPTAYFGYSTECLSQMAELLGKKDEKEYYHNLSRKVKDAYRKKFLPEGRISSDRQACYVRPIALDIIADAEKESAAMTLNEMVIANDYHLNTGFLSTPNLCHVLTEYGYTETAYKLLLQDTCPGWLYAVKKGATTIWETWDGKREDGSVHDSLNHYSYGAISGWLMRDVAGINVERGCITIAPKPDKVLRHAEAVYDSPLGLIKSAWKAEGDGFTYRVTIPANTNAMLIIPGREPITLTAGEYCL